MSNPTVRDQAILEDALDRAKKQLAEATRLCQLGGRGTELARRELESVIGNAEIAIFQLTPEGG